MRNFKLIDPQGQTVGAGVEHDDLTVVLTIFAPEGNITMGMASADDVIERMRMFPGPNADLVWD